MPAIRPGPLAILVVGLLAAVSRAGDATSPAQGRVAKAVTFEEQIRPILKANCFRCHGGEGEPKAGLDLRLRRLAADGGDSGPAIAPGKRGESLLYERVSRGEMPPTELKLSAAEVELIGAWIDDGAKTLGPEPEKIEPGLQITPEERSFWSFQRVPGEVAVPRPAAAERVRTPIDAFLLVELEKHGLAYSDEAAKAPLYTRAHFDLLGLPPDRGELAAFVADDDPMAYERAIDRMLDSPRYGERWGRYWLDVAGYADSDGYTAADSPRPFAYKYRDYVIRALNEDKPLDRFLVEQMAGDELAPIDRKHLTPDDVERLAATGFLRMAADGTASGAADVELARNQVMADTLKIVSTSLLGLSVGCAQCHDHRYDPILQSDYYRLRAVFEPALDWKHWRAPGERLVSLWTEGERAKAAEVDAEAAKVAAVRAAKQAEFMAEALEKEIAKHDDELQGALKLAYETPGDRRTPAQQKLLDEYPSVRNFSPGVLYQYNQAAADELKKIDAQIVAIQAKKPFQDFVPVLDEVPGQLPPTFLFHRGDHQQPKGEIAPGGLSVCSPPDRPFAIPADDPARPTSGRRLALAQWLTSDANPLTARVLVNRVWLNHFGRGLVNTPADFGSLGERPSHPELLDWLARDFMAGGWRLKRLHKLIMTSTAYRQSSARCPRGRARPGEPTVLADERAAAGRRDAARSDSGHERGVERADVRPLRAGEGGRGGASRGGRRRAANAPAAGRPRGLSPQHLHPGAPQPAAGHAARLRSAGDGNQLRAAHRVDRGDAVADVDEQRFHPRAGEVLCRASAETGADRSAGPSRGGLAIGVRPRQRRASWRRRWRFWLNRGRHRRRPRPPRRRHQRRPRPPRRERPARLPRRRRQQIRPSRWSIRWPVFARCC